VIVPTIDLLHQFYRLLTHVFHTEIGVYYGGEKILKPITVVTYSSFPSLMEQGNLFALLVADEIHHITAPAYGEGALMSPAPYRLGLTATYPSVEEEQRWEGKWRVEDLVGGPVVYQLRIDDLAGEQLAAYRTQRIRVQLTPSERLEYERDFTHYMRFVNERHLRRDFGAGWLTELQRLSARDREARAALLARQRVGRLLAGCQGKLQAVDELLREHLMDQILIFTEANNVAYHIAHQYFIPCISHLTSAAERKDILDGFQEKRYKCIITSRVLDEGVDLPEAKVAIILGGTTGARQYIQRLGRVLRRVENRQAVLYEVLVRGTSEEGKVQRRRAAVRSQGERDADIRLD
jgi:superfamily II DNA or RNA helicase